MNPSSEANNAIESGNTKIQAPAPFTGANVTVTPAPVDQLSPYPGNARKHSRKQISLIADSIARFGFNNPVLIDDEGTIIAGHGRVAAAKQLKLTAVPTIRLSHLSEADKRAYILAENKLAERAGWDHDILAVELQGLINLDFDIEVTGFAMGEVDIILDEADKAQRRERDEFQDEVPDLIPGSTVSLVGDLWLLGSHRLYCGDARDDQCYQHLLNGAKAELVFTDPPYNVPISGHVCGKGEIQHREFAMASGEMSLEDFTYFLKSVFARLVAHTTDGSIHFQCMDWRHIAEMMAAGNEVYSDLKNLIIWAKTNAGMGSFYRSQHELIFAWKSGTGAHINNFELGQHGRSRTNVWRYDGISTMRPGRREQLAMHPTVKPVALVADALKDCSKRRGLVLDPFTGSGTILIAAEQTGRRARSIEIDPGYVDVAVKRWQNFTGKTALLAESNETFADVQQHRTVKAPRQVAVDAKAIQSQQEAA